MTTPATDPATAPAAPTPSVSPPALPPSFIALAWANLAAQSAEQLSLAAVPMVAVMALGAGAGEIGLLAMVQTLPFLLLSIPLGLFADRHSRRRLMVWAEVLRAASLLGLLAAAFSGQLSLGLLAVLGFVGAVGTVAFSVAAPALVPALVPREALARANGKLELARSVAYAAGPALAGALVAWAGAPAAFVLAAMLSASAALLLWRLPEPERATAAPRHPLLELRDGAGMVWGNALLRPILLCSVAWNIAWFILQAAYVPYAMKMLGLDAQAVGLTLGCYGAGMVVGALLSQRVIAAMPYGRAVIIGPAFSVAAAGVMALTLIWPQGFLAALSYFLFGAGPILWTITSVTLRQTLTPTAMLGRVSAIFLTVNFGARPIGAALGGLIGAQWGESACVLIAFFAFWVQCAVIVASPIRTLKVLPPGAK